MPLKFIRQDITKIKCDAIVNPTNSRLMPGGGADLAIHKTAGRRLFELCRRAGSCEIGKAKITPGFSLPCKYVIHTVGPDWNESQNARILLESCYSECLKLAVKHNCSSIAFPLISSGFNGAPKDEVLKIATKVIGDFLFENDILVYLVVYDADSYEISSKVYSDVLEYIDDNYVKAHKEASSRDMRCFAAKPRAEFKFCDKCGAELSTDELFCSRCGAVADKTHMFAGLQAASLPKRKAEAPEIVCESVCAESPSLDDMIKNMDKGFADTLFYYIDQKGLTDVECYKLSNVDKKTFSKIKCNKEYRPGKATAVSFAVGLKLNEEETNHLLSTVGYCLSNSNLFDVIIKYFISSGNYESIFDVNEVLYKFDQVMLGV
ncbi:MAG: macro domain-containing protein [Clostridia bacterium]|nr:macro domain-containing protein [Clostridia bacterium]